MIALPGPTDPTVLFVLFLLLKAAALLVAGFLFVRSYAHRNDTNPARLLVAAAVAGLIFVALAIWA